MRAVGHSVAAVTALAAAPLAAGALAVRPQWRAGMRQRLGAVAAAAPGAVVPTVAWTLIRSRKPTSLREAR